MCALCGAFGVAEHWSDGTARAARGAERQHRLAVANRCLVPFGLRLADWAGRYTLTSRTGGSAVVDNFGALWPAAERLAGRPCDPLDRDLIDALDDGAAPR
jgi:hypothetical protein